MITLKDFFNSDKELAIHCDTKKKANTLLEAFDKLGKKWCNGDSYLEDNCWRNYGKDTCYTNYGMYSDKESFLDSDCKVYDFEDVILDDKMQSIILSDDELKIINDALELYDEQVTEGSILCAEDIKKNLGKLQEKIGGKIE